MIWIFSKIAKLGTVLVLHMDYWWMWCACMKFKTIKISPERLGSNSVKFCTIKNFPLYAIAGKSLIPTESYSASSLC